MYCISIYDCFILECVPITYYLNIHEFLIITIILRHRKLLNLQHKGFAINSNQVQNFQHWFFLTIEGVIRLRSWSFLKLLLIRRLLLCGRKVRFHLLLKFNDGANGDVQAMLGNYDRLYFTFEITSLNKLSIKF